MFEHTHLIDVNHFPKCDFLFKQSLKAVMKKGRAHTKRPWTGYGPLKGIKIQGDWTIT